MTTRRNVLITGACGFVGSHMVDYLLEKSDVRLRVTDLPTANSAFLHSEATFLPSDLKDPSSLVRVTQGIDVIYHTAALFRYSSSWEELVSVNVDGTQHLCQAASKSGVSKLVLISSSGVYGVTATLPIREEDPTRPSNLYEQSKLDQEHIARKVCGEEGLDLVILRPAPIYGPRNRYGIFTIIHMVAKGQLPIITENMNTLVPLVHVRDVVGAANHLAVYPRAVGEVYNVADDTSYRKYDLLSDVAPLVDAKIYHTHLPLPRVLLKALAAWSEWKAKHITHGPPKVEKATIDLMYSNYWYSNEKLKQTGYRLEYPDCSVGLKETIDWYKQHQWL